MDKFTKRSAVFMILIAVIFILLIPLEVFLVNKTDAISTQLLLMQAAGEAGYTELMTVKSWLKVIVGVIGALKIIAGVFMIFLGAAMLNRGRKNKNEIKQIDTDNIGENND